MSSSCLLAWGRGQLARESNAQLPGRTRPAAVGAEECAPSWAVGRPNKSPWLASTTTSNLAILPEADQRSSFPASLTRVTSAQRSRRTSWHCLCPLGSAAVHQARPQTRSRTEETRSRNCSRAPGPLNRRGNAGERGRSGCLSVYLAGLIHIAAGLCRHHLWGRNREWGVEILTAAPAPAFALFFLVNGGALCSVCPVGGGRAGNGRGAIPPQSRLGGLKEVIGGGESPLATLGLFLAFPFCGSSSSYLGSRLPGGKNATFTQGTLTWKKRVALRSA